jgi:eukaryotic-like serine/threonine-protein kinase
MDHAAPDTDLEHTRQSEPAARPALVLQRPPTGHELAPLLRRRLMIVAILAAVTCAFFSSYRLSLPNQPEFFRAAWFGAGMLIFEAAFALTSLALAILMWRRSWSLRTLRRVELGLAAAFAVYIAWAQLRSGARFTGPSGAIDPFVMRQVVDSMAGRWFALIVGISTLVPETWRRNAVLVGALALSAVAVTTYMGIADPLYRPHLAAMLSLMFFWMVAATTIAVFGSYKLAELRQQVAEARRLGQYRLVRHIGTGGMGEVHLAEHMMLKQPCAIKMIRPDLARDRLAMQRFEREVRAMSRLKHWNTVQVFDYGYADDGTFYYAMEYLPGITLQELVATYGALPAGRAVHYLRQICAALREVHAMRLVHRDIKPSNVIACERGGVFDVAKLLDFGIVRRAGLDAVAETVTSDNLFVGTPAYMSPEQARGSGETDAAGDIYSLGAVGYFLMTGRAPFERSTALLVLMAHLNEAPVPPSAMTPGVPADLERVVLRCLCKEPRARFADVQALDDALTECASAGVWSAADAESWWKTHASGGATAVRAGAHTP